MTARAVMIALTLFTVESSIARAQAALPTSREPVPRFLRVSADSARRLSVVNPSDEPILNRVIAINLPGVSRGLALREIGLTAGVEFVYSGDALPRGGLIRFQADHTTVAGALTEVLRDAGVDVVVGANGNLILMKKPPVAVPVVTKGTVCRGPGPQEEAVPLCLDGNGVAALRAQITLAGIDGTIGYALRSVAATAAVHITLEAALPALDEAAIIAPGTYTVAEALLRIVTGKPITIFVTGAGSLSVRALPGGGTTLAPVHTVVNAEARERFNSLSTLGPIELTAHDLASAPALFEADVFHSVQLLPGVETRNDYSAGLNVRGGESDQNLILLDGYPLYNPFHLGGLLGTFIDPMVGKVDLLTGAMPPRYGERLSSVLDVQSSEESRHGLHGAGDISMLAALASVGSAFDDGGSWMLAGRRTYADAIADLIKPNSLPYHFEDAQGHLSRSVLGGATLSVTAYAGDDASSVTSNRAGVYVSWDNTVLGATLSKMLPDHHTLLGLVPVDSIALVQRASVTTFNASAQVQSSNFDLQSTVHDLRTSGSATFFTRVVDQSVGYEVAGQHLRYALQAPITVITNVLPAETFDASPTAVSAWYDALVRVSPRLLVDAGARYDAVNGTGWAGWSPRLSVKYFLSKDMALTLATGSYSQWLHALAQEDTPVQPLEFWVASSATLPVSHVWQSSVGVQGFDGPSREYRIEGFYKAYQHLPETNPLALPNVPSDQFIELGGSSYGADVLVRQRDNGRFGGWISYSYAVSERVTPTGVWFNPGQDRRHELNAVGTWRLERYRLSLRIGLATGTPYTPIVGEFTRERYDPVGNTFGPDFGDGNIQYLPGALNSARYTLNHRLDLNLTRVGRGDRVQVSPYISIANVYNSANPAVWIYDYNQAVPTRNSVPNLPFLPTVGVHIVY